jgi:hypothetical protein
MKEKQISFFLGGSSNVIPKGTMSFASLIKQMTNTPKIKKQFDELRKTQKLDVTKFKRIKNKLPYLTPSGQFTQRNNMSLIRDTYTWVCSVDIDKQDNPKVDMNMVQNMLCSEDWVIFCGKSPSGTGLKAFIRLKAGAYNIDDHYRIMTEVIYEKLGADLGCVLDYAQGKLSQPFYLTYDADAYINLEATELNIDYKLKEKITNTKPDEATTIKKDYLVDAKCKVIENLVDNFWIHIGEIGFTLGGWFKAGHFDLTEKQIKDKLKLSVDRNNNIKNKQHKYQQIDLTFKNGCAAPIYIKQDYENVDTFKKDGDGSFDFKKSTRDEIKKFNHALEKAPVYQTLDFTGSLYNPTKIYIENDYLLYPILKENQLAILFGLTGEGKSILAFEFANCIANGSCPWKGFRVDTKPQDVLYIDFELGASSFSSRYKNPKFSKNIHIVNVNVYEYNSMIGFERTQPQRLDRAITYIEELSKKYYSKVIFIDNLSNIADQVEQAAEADRFISDLYGRMKALDLTIFFLGHTPKIQAAAALTLNQLKGSSSLTKTFESVIGFKRVEGDVSYIKQLKYRQLENIFDEQNVAKFDFDTSTPSGWTMSFVGNDVEDELLPDDGKPKIGKYTDDMKIEILYEANVLQTKRDLIYEKYDINNSGLYRLKQELRYNKNDISIKYNMFCEEKNQKIF